MRTINEIKAANRELGHHFFSRDTLRFFASRVYNDVIECADGACLFVTSEKRGFEDFTRVYTVRRAHVSGNVTTASEFGKYPSRHKALIAARAFAELKEDTNAA